MSKTISIIGTAGIPAKYGGFETLAEYLVKYLGGDYDLNVFCSSKIYEQKIENYHGARLHYVNLKANGLSSIPYDIISILKACKFSDTLLVLGVSGAVILPFLRLFSKVKIVTNIDGIEWKRNKWNLLAKVYLRLQEWLAVKFSHIIVADNEGIQNYVTKSYQKESELIAYGGDHSFHVPLTSDVRKAYNIQEDYAFSVCRIEPENNIHVILSSFQKANLNLVIVGNWNDSSYGTKLKETYGGDSNMILLDPIYDQTVLNSLRSNCNIYVHGHSAGGTNPSLVEAMNLALPIICWKVNYNTFTTKGKAKYFSSVHELTEILNQLTTSNLKELGQDMKLIAKNHYNWSVISSLYADLF